MREPVRKLIPYEEFDYQVLLGALKNYARKQPYSREILANLIYGPSCISLEYALQYYGMIPERVEAVTSVTVGRSRKFSTPQLSEGWGPSHALSGSHTRGTEKRMDLNSETNVCD